MLWLIHHIDADAAFDILRWRSRETNTKLRPFAKQLATEFSGLVYDDALPPHSAYDQLLLTAHLRLADQAHQRNGRSCRTDQHAD
jgi:hypothetical protein